MFAALLCPVSGMERSILDAIDYDDHPEWPILNLMLSIVRCEHGSAEIARTAVDSGADVNEPCDKSGVFPLLVASAYARAGCVRLLIRAGADVNKRRRMTPRHTTSAANRFEHDFVTPLLAACISGNLDVVRLLVDAGADVNDATSFGDTPLVVAIRHACGKCSLVEYLLSVGANVNVRTAAHQPFPIIATSPLQQAVECWDDCAVMDNDPRLYSSIVRLLIDAGASVRGRARIDREFEPILCVAARVEKMATRCVTTLVKAGGDIRCCDSTGKSPIDILLERKKPRAARRATLFWRRRRFRRAVARVYRTSVLLRNARQLDDILAHVHGDPALAIAALLAAAHE